MDGAKPGQGIAFQGVCLIIGYDCMTIKLGYNRTGRQRHDSLPLGGFNHFATGIPCDPLGKGLDVDFFFEHPLFVDVFPRVSS